MTIEERTTPSALTFAKLLGDGPMARVALEASLAELGSAAFIVSERGTVLYANTDAKKKLAASSQKIEAGILRALSTWRDPDADDPTLVTPLRCADGPVYYLVVFRPPSSVAESVDYVADLWALTPRQRDVLELLAEGFSNKTIASRLGCAERTIETHLTAIYGKSGLDSRSALLAAIARGRP